jgi:hypothetical protein
MRREYDFSQGTRGKHAGKRIQIVGDKKSRNKSETADKISKVIERNPKSGKPSK